ncbi:unnamed protein product [Adineta steineri]|uniref:FH2 domain-containing protein n=1 Tax=Adineta steineri TaxID=433720 RepID=A0A814A916_9BILA|nr:unnamed protein product [Adineta steineri]CAF3728174.1 unnamed protein product [Adineta steineri]
MTSSQSPSNGFVGLPPPPPPPPAPPVFNNTNNLCKILLPHQEVNLVVNRANVTEIQARSIPTMLMAGNNIWTRRVVPNLRIQQTIFDEHYGESKSTMTGHYRRSSLTTSFIGGGGIGGINDDGPLSFVLLDATSKMLYDVPMRHLLQLVKKDHDDDASIDHVIRAIDETHMKSEWLDAVTALNKQFDKRPEDKARVLAHKGSTHGLVLIEQFFVKLVRVPAYEFKLIYLKFREEAPTQLERMSKHINDLLESVQVILTNEQLPGILHLLCLLYNSITGKTIPGLHFDSILSVLSTRTPKQNTTISHVLCHLLEEQYSTLLNIFDNQILLKLKDLSSIKYIPIYIDIRLLYTRYKQLNTTLRELQQQLIILPEHIKTTLNDLQLTFTKLFDDENKIKKCEKDLASYFCVWDLSLEVCLSTLGQFIDKIRLAHMQNVEQRRRNDLALKQQLQNQRTYENRTLQTPTTSRLLRSSQNQYGSDTNIFRDHLNVPLTPTATRQRFKVNKTSRERFCASSRDVSHINDDQQEQIESTTPSPSPPLTTSITSTPMRTQNLLPNAIPRKRGHSPATKTVFTKRPFNALPVCSPPPIQDQQQLDDVFISPITSNEKEDDNDTHMDCSTATTMSTSTATTTTEEINSIDMNVTDDHSLPTNESSAARMISVCEIRPSFYLTTSIRRLFDPSTDQSTPNDTSSSSEYKTSNSISPSFTDYQHYQYSNNDNEHNKENSKYPSTLTPITSSSSSEIQIPTELPSLSNPIEDDSQQCSSSSSSSLPADISNDENHSLPIIPLLLSDSETLDEGFETQSNISETVELITPRSCPLEPISHEINDIKCRSIEETLADDLTRRLTFNSTRRLSHDSGIRINSKRISLANARQGSLLKTSASAYSYPTFNSNGLQNQHKHLFTKRTPSAESIRSILNNNNSSAIALRSSRHIQRCAVSRRIWTEKDTDDTSKTPATSPSSSTPLSPSSTQPTSVEPDDVSSSSTATTTTTTTTAKTSTMTMMNHRIPSSKAKNKIRNLQSLTNASSRSNSPLIRKIPPRLGHASSCQNVSTITPTNTNSKSSLITKTRSPPNFFLNSSQLLRSTFTRSNNEKPLRAFQMSTTMNNESSVLNRPSPRIRRLFSSSSDIESTTISSPKPVRKPPSSYHHQKSSTNKTVLTTVLPSSSLPTNRKKSTSTSDLRKTTPMNSSVFQRLTQSKRL